jgi:alkanesulfonate monooxygenase SsuD/methylene tetrahydromethanopterin reductase-like flavin-dependent oxidoreductase (luciferase family)
VNVGIGLPSAVPHVRGEVLAAWAARAEERGFTSLGVVDRLLYDSYDPLVALSAAAAVTTKIRLVTMIVIAPLRNATLLAKQAASLDALSGGRLVLGVALGARDDDYERVGVPRSGRGKRLADQLVALRTTWEDEAVGPAPERPGGPPLVVGGSSDRTFARMARHADGYVHGGGPPRTFERAAHKARAAWADGGRPGAPMLWAQGYFALGDAVDAGLAYMHDYYRFAGPFAAKIAEGLLPSPQAVVQFVRGYAEAGCDELVLLPAAADLDQIDRLADALRASVV